MAQPGFFVNVFIFAPFVISYLFYVGDDFKPEDIGGKRILVTGASSGIGEQVAYKYAQLGARLMLTARRTLTLEKVANECKRLGAASVFTATADMTSPNDRKKLVEETISSLGGLDYLILSHSVSTPSAEWQNSAHNMTQLAHVMNVNFFAYVDVASRAMKELKLSRGSIAVVTSGAGKSGFSGFTQYCSSKHALHGFFSSLRQELRRGDAHVSVTFVVYGAIDMVTVGKMTKGSELDVGFQAEAAQTDDAAQMVVEGVANGKYEIEFPFSVKLFRLLLSFVPETTEQILFRLLNGKFF